MKPVKATPVKADKKKPGEKRVTHIDMIVKLIQSSTEVKHEGVFFLRRNIL